MKTWFTKHSYNWSTRLRIASDSVLYFYVVTHLLNHSLGTLDLETMEAGRVVFLAFWRFPPIELLPLLAFLLHLGLALYALFHKKSFKHFKVYEWIQSALEMSKQVHKLVSNFTRKWNFSFKLASEFIVAKQSLEKWATNKH